MGFPMAAGMAPPGAMPGMFGAGMGMPGFNPMAMQGLQGGVGPMRSHGGRNGMNGGGRMGGPYARNDGRGRGPVRGGVMGMMGGLVGMEGGAGAIGPQEAVAGRSIRSYEDLDATGVQQDTSPELNY